MELIRYVDAIAKRFRPVFARQAAFSWFVVVLWALMLRLEAAGVTSIVRCMGLHPAEYANLLHFFHSTAFRVDSLCKTWMTVLRDYTQPVLLNGQSVYLADAIKVGKAGRRMPGVKLLHQESDDNTKAEYIMGHFWGAVSLLCTAGGHFFSIPLRFQIQDGIKRSPTEAATLVDKMHALITATVDRPGTVIADAYYCSRAWLAALRTAHLQFIGRVRISTVGYELPPPPPSPRPRGRPRKRGPKVKLRDLFEQSAHFEVITLALYGKVEKLRYHCVDLLWQGLLVRFVLTIYSDGTRTILLATDRTLSPETIIWGYSLRFKIEVSFKALVHVLSGFCYHFWMKAMPKVKRGDGNQFLHRADAEYRRQVYRKLEAYERFVNISAIGLGILQVLAIQFRSHIWDRFPVWLRTLPKHGCPSENVVRLTLQHELHRVFLENNDSPLLQEILGDKRKQDPGPSGSHPISLAASG